MEMLLAGGCYTILFWRQDLPSPHQVTEHLRDLNITGVRCCFQAQGDAIKYRTLFKREGIVSVLFFFFNNLWYIILKKTVYEIKEREDPNLYSSYNRTVHSPRPVLSSTDTDLS